MSKILKEGKSYTFSDYFDLNCSTKELIKEFGYGYHLEELVLPRSDRSFPSLALLKESYIKKLPLISLNSETAKREFYVATFLFAILDYLPIEINVEYALDGGDNLRGVVEYFLQFQHTSPNNVPNNVIVIEAKRGDLDRGFTQLAIELIALEKVLDTKNPFLYGIVTLGDIWQFGILERDRHLIKKDLNAYPLISSLETLCAILIGILDPLEKSGLN